MKAKSRGFLKNLIILAVILAVSGLVYYLSVISSVYFYQRKYIFLPPDLGKETPADFRVPYNEIYFESDGLKLMGWWASHGEDRPALLYTHGNGASLSLLAHVSKLLYDYGWNVFMFDYRGYGKSELRGTTISEENIYRDSKAAYEWVRSKSKGQKIVLWGHSLGSSIAARLSADYQVDGLILEGAFTSMFDMAKHRFSTLPIFDFMIWDKFDTKSHVKNRKFTPVLFIHGEEDSVIPISLGRETFSAAAQPKEFIAIPNMDHNQFPDFEPRYREQIKEILASWQIF